eukprot:12896991-Prorocentrum_lima.AAC.1
MCGHPQREAGLPFRFFWCVANVEVGEWGHGHHGDLVPAMWTEAEATPHVQQHLRHTCVNGDLPMDLYRGPAVR